MKTQEAGSGSVCGGAGLHLSYQTSMMEQTSSLTLHEAALSFSQL